MEADSSSQQTIATFTGTLLRREHATGQKFVQLVFREGDENWLCVSSKLANAKLAIGQEYRVEGEFRQAGGRAYIHEPRIAPVRGTAKGARKPAGGHKKAWVISSSAFASLLLIGGVVFALHGNGSGQQLNATNAASHTPQTYSTNTKDTSTAADQQTSTDTTDTTATTPPATTPVTTTTTKKASTPTSTGPSSGTTNPPVATTPASTAHCDVTPIPIVYDGEPADPDAAALGTRSGGTAGSTQTCYDDAANDNPVITTVAMEHGTWTPTP